MVGLFSRFSSGRIGHRRSQSAANESILVPPNTEVPGSATAGATHGFEVAVEFKPIEHPVEPLDNDHPVRCPLPEPSILNDGRIWKERLSATVEKGTDLPEMKGGSNLDSESGVGTRRQTNRMVLPSSISAPEHNIITLLEECNAIGI